MRIHSITRNSYANGPGSRTVLHLQGCTLGCAGCINHKTWEKAPKDSVDHHWGEVVSMLGLESGDRLTVSGGEPLQQAEDLYRVLWAVRPLVRDIILFSGYTPEEIRKLSIWASRCCQLTDLVVAGRYDRTKRRTDKPLCGSDNQELCFNPLGALRLSDLADVPTYEIDLDGSGAYVMTGFLPGGGTE